MKKTLTLTALMTKLITLVCVSGMGFLGFVQDSFATQISPCHQEFVQDDKTDIPCDMCVMALEAWEENAVATSETVIISAIKFELTLDAIVQSFVFNLKPLEGIYQAYYPPPQVLLKSVTPNTKTIVLLS